MTPSPRPAGPTSVLRYRSAVGVLFVFACLLFALAAPAAEASRACPSARAVHARTASGAHVERAIVCMVNRVRRRAGLRPLRVNRCLDRLADRHARDMVARRYFAHSSAGGRSLAQRARTFGYRARGRGWLVGENLAWGTGRASRARWVVRAWMRSPSHRRNILTRAFRDVGVAAVRGTPNGTRGLRRPRTFTLDLGARGSSRCLRVRARRSQSMRISRSSPPRWASATRATTPGKASPATSGHSTNATRSGAR